MKSRVAHSLGAGGMEDSPTGAWENRVRVEFDEAQIDAIFDDINQCQLPGAAVGIALGGRPVYRKGFGLANMELAMPLSPTMRMRVASITKQFTALAYLLLCEDGRARIDDRIGSFLPELHPANRNVTARQLMSHVSGLRDAKDICLQFSGPGKAVSSSDLLSFYRSIDNVNAPPGEAWCYNNGGYVLLGAAIERITGEPLENVIRSRILEPVGMHDTLLRRWDTDFVPNSATLHMTSPKGGYEKAYLGIASSAEGGLVSTIDDMLRWLAHMADPVVGAAETWRVLKSPYRLPNGTSTGYSAGLITGHYRGVETISHSGGVMGGSAHLLKVPSAHLDIVVMSNRHDLLSAALANKVLDACLPDLQANPTPSRPLASGIFRSRHTGRVIELLSREGRQFAVVDGYEMLMEHARDGWLTPAEPCTYLRQAIRITSDSERPDAIRLADCGTPDELVAERLNDRPDSRSITGRYRSAATGTDAIICDSDEGLQLRTIGRFGSVTNKLEPLVDRVWRATPTTPMPASGILTFDQDGETFRFTNLRTRSLPFRRCS